MTSLTSVTIQPGATYIGCRAFVGGDNLETITIPSSVNIISAEIVSNCVIKSLLPLGTKGAMCSNSAIHHPMSYSMYAFLLIINLARSVEELCILLKKHSIIFVANTIIALMFVVLILAQH